MPRTFDEILAEVSSKSDPQRQIVMRQIADLTPQQQAGEASLDAKRDRGFEDIELGARRRGVAYWGAPIAEQQKYLATDYLPAVANLKSTFNERRNTLDSALADYGRNDYTSARSIFDSDRGFEEQQRQFNENLAFQRQEAARQAAASARSGPAPTLGGPQEPQYMGNNDWRGHLSYLAQKQGNKDATTALKYVGNDNRYYLDPFVTNPKILQALDRLGATNTWGARR